jgi:hypothetical protein
MRRVLKQKRRSVETEPIKRSDGSLPRHNGADVFVAEIDGLLNRIDELIG